MSEEQIKGAIRGFLDAMTVGDATNAISFLATDAVFITPLGTFKGSAEISKFITWSYKNTKDYKIKETGIGIIAQGNTGVIEHDVSGTYNGMKWEVPAMCIYEFKNDKIVNMRSFYDRLAQAKQGAKGFIPRWAVNSVANAMEKGLR